MLRDNLFSEAALATTGIETYVSPPLSKIYVYLFTDLVDSTGWKKHLLDRDYANELRIPHDKIFRKLLKEYPDAEERDNAGDGFLATFTTSSHATSFALKFHRALATYDWSENVRKHRLPATRIGIHLGEVVEFTDEAGMKVAGQAVDLTARLMSLGKGGFTLLTRHAFDSSRQHLSQNPADPTIPLAWVAHGRYRFKGNEDDPLEVFAVAPAGSHALDVPPDSEKALRVTVNAVDDTGAWRPAVGQTIPFRDNWVVEKQIGEGGFGEVWLACNKRTKELRVFKFCFDVERLRSFKRELTLFRLLQSEFGNRKEFLRLYDVQLERPPFFLESEYVTAGNLGEWATPERFAAWSLEDRIRFAAETSEAVASAHSLGIIHKDLKPSNILIREVQQKPEPIVADFGIGVLTDRSQLEKRNITETGAMNTLLGNDSSRTGTRLYAPPESMLGKPATTGYDVYAMGVFLYQLLVGSFNEPLGTGWEESLPDSDSIRTKLLVGDIRDATRADASKRLANMSALAERLRTIDGRVVAKQKELTNKRNEQRVQLLKRALVIATLLVVSLGSLSVYAWQQRNSAQASAKREKERADELVIEKQRVVEAHRETDSAYRSARGAVDHFFTEVSESALLNQPGLQTLRRDLLVDARKYYEEFVAARSAGPDWTADVALSRFNLARVHELLGDTEAARASYDQALELQQKICDGDSANLSAKSLLGDMVNGKSRLLQSIGDLPASVQLNERALALRQQLVDAQSSNVEATRKLANSHMNQGILAMRQGDLPVAKASLLKAQSLRGVFVDTANDRALARDYAKGFYNLGLLHQQLGEDVEAATALNKSVELLDSLVRSHATDLEMKFLLSTCLRTLGDAAADRADVENAVSYYNRAVNQLKELTSRNPEVFEYKMGLAGVHINLVELQKESSPAAANESVDTAIKLLRSLEPSNSVSNRDLALGLRLRAELTETTHLADAIRDVEDAQRLLKTIHDQPDSSLDVSEELGLIEELLAKFKVQ